MQIKWGEYEATVSGGVSLTPGIDPDTFTITVAPPIAEKLDREADLTIDDGVNDPIVFQGCRAAEGSLNYSPTGRSASFIARDRRWKWGYALPIFGEYNRRDEEGNLVGTQKSSQELATLLLDQLGETGYDVTGLDAADNPYVQWEYAHTATALSDLASRSGASIVLRTDNTVKIYAANTGETETTEEPIEEVRRQRIIDKPENVILVGGRSRYQVYLELTAVGYDPSVEGWVDMETGPSWKPSGFPGYYTGFEDAITDEEDRKAAKLTAFRCYRLPSSITLGIYTLNVSDAMRYWTDEIVETENVTSAFGLETEKRRKAPYVYGKHWTEAYYSNPWANRSDTGSRVDVDFTIDKRRGMIWFSEPVRYESASEPLVLVCAFEYDPTRIPFIYDGVSGVSATIERPDIVYEYDDGTELGKEEVDARALVYADSYMKRYNAPELFRSYTYSGFLNLWPDGKISEVVWQFSTTDGPTTSTTTGPAMYNATMEDRENEIQLAALARRRKQQESSNLVQGLSRQVNLNKVAYEFGFSKTPY